MSSDPAGQTASRMQATRAANDREPWRPSVSALRAMGGLARTDGAGGPVTAGRAEPAGQRLWAVVLAGGRGTRLRPLVSLIHGDDRPKQYAALLDSRSMLRHTLDRVALSIPVHRTVVVVSEEDAPYAAAELGAPGGPHVLRQPTDRGTGAGVLLPAHWIAGRDPDATVAVFPADHFVLGEAALMDHVAVLARLVRDRPAGLVLLGAPPTGPDPGYGWIESGERAGGTPVHPLRRVRRFREKPSPEAARTLFLAGSLWNTFIFVVRVQHLLDVARTRLPALTRLLAGVEAVAGTADEGPAIRQAYGRADRADFARAILEPCASSLLVSPLSAVTWADWGTPERVLATLQSTGIRPAWLRQLDRAATVGPWAPPPPASDAISPGPPRATAAAPS